MKPFQTAAIGGAMLTECPCHQDARLLINLHLMHTSYFLFVMVITMFCYAVVKGRPGKVWQAIPDFCPEKTALSEG